MSVYNFFKKNEFSIATATFFSVIRFCSDLIHARFFSLRGYHNSKDNNRNCYVTSVARDSRKNVM